MDIEDLDVEAVSRDRGRIEETVENVTIHQLGGGGAARRRKKKLPRAEPGSLVPGGGKTIFLKSYGCGHNMSDAEVMAGLLAQQGYNITDRHDDDYDNDNDDDDDDDHIDAYLINSCTVKNPSESAFRSLVEKSKKSGKPVIVAGCVPQADHKKKGQWDDVSVVGVEQIDRVVEVVDQALQGNKVHLLSKKSKKKKKNDDENDHDENNDDESKPRLDLPKVRRNDLIEIIPINLGCKGDCTYCKTKMARGTLQSYSVQQIVSRVQQCVLHEGVREIRLTSEDVGAYGLDINTNIVHLLRAVLRAIDQIPKKKIRDQVMVRMGMANPPFILQHLEDIAECLRHPNMYSFVHIPVQSGNDRVLQAMRREYTVEEFCTVCDTLLRHCPEMTIATDIICGFPGETEEEFEDTLRLVRRYQFSVLNISQFYPRPGTPAARLALLPTHTVKERSRRLSDFFNEGIRQPYGGLLGTRQKVWITERAHDGVNACGHTKSYVQVIVPWDDTLLGTRVTCHIVETGRFFVRGIVVQEEEEEEEEKNKNNKNKNNNVVLNNNNVSSSISSTPTSLFQMSTATLLLILAAMLVFTSVWLVR